MNEAIKTLENTLGFVCDEIERISNDPNVSTQSFTMLRTAKVDLINIIRNLEQARQYNA